MLQKQLPLFSFGFCCGDTTLHHCTMSNNNIVRVNDSYLSDPNLTVYGDRNTIAGMNATVFGNSNTVTGMNASVRGDSNTVTGMNASVNGNDNTVTGMNSTLNGSQAQNFGATWDFSDFNDFTTITVPNGHTVAFSGGTFTTTTHQNNAGTTGQRHHHYYQAAPIQVNLRGDDEETDDASQACRLCLTNKKVVMSTCCQAFSTCVECSRSLYTGKQVGDVQCMLCNSDVTEVFRVS